MQFVKMTKVEYRGSDKDTGQPNWEEDDVWVNTASIAYVEKNRSYDFFDVWFIGAHTEDSYVLHVSDIDSLNNNQ